MTRTTQLVLALLGATIFVSGTLTADQPAAGSQVARTTTVALKSDAENEDVTLRYWLYLPKQYDEMESVPLMLFLHGAGERGEDLEVVKKWGPPKLIDAGKEFPFILASPQCSANERWQPDALAKLVDHLAGEFKVDRNRIYCTGLSMGGYGTWSILAKYPNLFAAGAPICGGGQPDDAEKLTNIPIWAFHGDADSVVPVAKSQEMVDAIKKAGGENVQLTIYPGVNHNSWSQAYADPKLYHWLLSQRRAD